MFRFRSKFVLSIFFGCACLATAKNARADEEKESWRAATFQVTLQNVKVLCPGLKINSNRADAAFKYYEQQIGVDVRVVPENASIANKNSDSEIVLATIRDSRRMSIEKAVAQYGRDNFCTGSFWMYGPRGMEFAGVLDYQ
jgi:hypothetical protein